MQQLGQDLISPFRHIQTIQTMEHQCVIEIHQIQRLNKFQQTARPFLSKKRTQRWNEAWLPSGFFFSKMSTAPVAVAQVQTWLPASFWVSPAPRVRGMPIPAPDRCLKVEKTWKNELKPIGKKKHVHENHTDIFQRRFEINTLKIFEIIYKDFWNSGTIEIVNMSLTCLFVGLSPSQKVSHVSIHAQTLHAMTIHDPTPGSTFFWR